MMNYVYAVYDHGTGMYSPPIVSANDDLAVRNYLYVYGEPDKIRKTCTSFRRIAYWNNETGIFESVDCESVDAVLYAFIDKLHSDDEVIDDGETSEC